MARSLRLNATELAVLGVLLGMRITPLSTTRMKRADALESLVKRRIVDDKVERVNLQVATLLAILARPAQQITIHRTGSATPHRVVCLQTRSHVVQDLDGEVDVITPHRDALALFEGDLESSASAATSAPFSIPGRTWHDMVAQAKYATDQQLARMAEIDGLDDSESAVAARLAKAHGQRLDARVMSYRGKNHWRGAELSWISSGSETWLVDDGARFGGASDLASRRATFTRGRVDDALRAALSSLDPRF
ncbi:MAG: hypothetical protein ACKOFZ_02380 [Ilumatobacteraceae bacterium]